MEPLADVYSPVARNRVGGARWSPLDRSSVGISIATDGGLVSASERSVSLLAFGDQLIPALESGVVARVLATAATGGFLGAGVREAFRFGIARGVYSNEAGTGSVPIAHASAKSSSPAAQGRIAMLGVFIDTLSCLDSNRSGSDCKRCLDLGSRLDRTDCAGIRCRSRPTGWSHGPAGVAPVWALDPLHLGLLR